jgi:hypothetical protein
LRQLGGIRPLEKGLVSFGASLGKLFGFKPRYTGKA